jgi:hypothetical protein
MVVTGPCDEVIGQIRRHCLSGDVLISGQRGVSCRRRDLG